MADIPDNVLFRVLSNRIHYTNLMPWINDVNSKDPNAQLNFVLAVEDWRQWKVFNEHAIGKNACSRKVRDSVTRFLNPSPINPIDRSCWS